MIIILIEHSTNNFGTEFDCGYSTKTIRLYRVLFLNFLQTMNVIEVVVQVPNLR